MKKYLLVLIATLTFLTANAQTFSPVYGGNNMLVQDKMAARAPFFPLSDVRLFNSPFKKAMELDVTYLLELEPDRLLHRFHLNAGLPPKGDLYGGWESQGISGHTMGHYLSALALGHAATGDPKLLEKLKYTVNELAICQQTRKTGYVGAIIHEDSVFADIAKGKITSAGFDLNGLWVPWYTIHKVFAGLEDAYLYTGNQQALTVCVGLGEWVNAITAQLTPADWQKMLACEHGGMNETLVNLYAMTGREMFLELSRKFHHHAILDPLSLGKDELAGKHANTQIPKIIGCIRRYELTGDEKDRQIASFFWETVVKHHSYVIGGNSNFEHFGHADHLSDQLSESTTETCNTNNMLKLTRHLFSLEPGGAWMDYYERALYNHILASQNPETGMMCYFVPLKTGGEKTYSDKFNSFWCCVGTGIENHVKYGESIYAHGQDGALMVNLFIPSELNWRQNGVRIKQETQFPQSDKITLSIAGNPATPFPLSIRFPSWATSAVVKINGKKQKITAQPGTYITLTHPWKNGDRVEVQFPIHLYTEAMPDRPDQRAVLYGPLVLAGELETPNAGSAYDAPVLVADAAHPAKWLESTGAPLTFRTKSVGYPRDIQFSPFYQRYNKPYAVYFDFFTKAGLDKHKAAYEAEQQRIKALAARTVDVLRIGEMQPERDHELTGEKTFSGGIGEKKWRDARDGGWFSFVLKTDAVKPNILQCTYWGNDGNGREFDILVDGVVVATQVLIQDHPNQFFEKEYEMPAALTAGKQQVTVRFQAHPGKTAGGMFGVRMIRAE